jgi:hypothetical protein
LSHCNYDAGGYAGGCSGYLDIGILYIIKSNLFVFVVAVFVVAVFVVAVVVVAVVVVAVVVVSVPPHFEIP